LAVEEVVGLSLGFGAKLLQRLFWGLLEHPTEQIAHGLTVGEVAVTIA